MKCVRSRKEQIKARRKTSLIDKKQIAEILMETMVFSKRRDAIDKLNILIKKNNPDFEFTFENFNNEWMSYTIIVRADLLYFENWITKFRELNMNFEIQDQSKYDL